MRLNELLTESNQIENNPIFISDLKSVSEWINIPVGEIKINLKNESIEKFKTQIIEMYNTYEEFPDDETRTNKIINLLRRGHTPLPIWVEENDTSLFVMEGRHRMVAFYLLGMKTIPVAYVSRK